MGQTGRENKISSLRQLGGIETSVLDSGRSKGVRIAWIDTGSGLRYKVVLDRSMDIVDTFINQYCISWLSNVGITPPSSQILTNQEWLRGFSGGLLTTCGLDHVGPHEIEDDHHRGMHGRVSFIPAEDVVIKQPDFNGKDNKMSVTGIVRDVQPLGNCLELNRTINSYLGESKIEIIDNVTNVGNTTSPHMLLYHINFGFPLVDMNSLLLWKGKVQNEVEGLKSLDYHVCPDIVDRHAGGGEDVLFIKPDQSLESYCISGIYNRHLELAVFIKFDPELLPCLTNWRHFGKNEYVTALEPGTNFPIGQREARENNKLIYLKPQETRQYKIEIEVLNRSSKIKEFINNHNINEKYGLRKIN